MEFYKGYIIDYHGALDLFYATRGTDLVTAAPSKKEIKSWIDQQVSMPAGEMFAVVSQDETD